MGRGTLCAFLGIPIIGEKIGVNALDLICGFGGDAQIVFNHQFCKLLAIHKDNFGGMLLIGVFAGFFGELCGCDKKPLRGALTGQGTDKLLNFRATDGRAAVLTLGLNVNQAEAKFILTNQAVNAFVSGLANHHSGDSCRENHYAIGYYEILGYGMPQY